MSLKSEQCVNPQVKSKDFIRPSVTLNMDDNGFVSCHVLQKKIYLNFCSRVGILVVAHINSEHT